MNATKKTGALAPSPCSSEQTVHNPTITPERIERARAKLLGEAAAIRQHCEKVREIAAGPLLDKQDGKTANARLYPLFAEAYGCEKAENWQGKTYYPGARWSMEYCAPLNCGQVPCFVLEGVCKGWGIFPLPLICRDGDRLDAKATREAWEKVIELRAKWVLERETAAKMLDRAAEVYNRVEREVMELCAWMEAEAEKVPEFYNPEITTLCAFGGDIYDRLNPFRWHEQKPENA